jgi:hypothetical protein
VVAGPLPEGTVTVTVAVVPVRGDDRSPLTENALFRDYPRLHDARVV